jgi:recombinational DNA repair protein (RecF pathway)
MEKLQGIKSEPVKCVNCNEPLTTFMAYIPGKGDACLKCFAEYAQAQEKLSQ